MRRLKEALVFVVSAILLTGCLQFDGDGILQKQIVPFTATVSPSSNVTKSVIAAEDTQTEMINSLHLWAYESGENGSLVQARYFTNETLDKAELSELNKGRSYFIIAIANAEEGLQAPSTRNGLNSLRLSYTNLVSELRTKGVPMVCTIDALTPTWFQKPVEIKLTRLVSRYDLQLVRDFSNGGTFTVTSLTLKNSPKSVTLLGQSKAADSSDVCDGDQGSADDKLKLNEPGSFASFYILENCQGTVSSIVKQEQKVADNIGDKASVCTYFEIVGDYQNKGIRRSGLKYRLYLGQNMTNDFNVVRNTLNKITLSLASEGGNDLHESWRVEGGVLTDERTIVFDPNPVTVPSKGTATCTVTTSPSGVKYSVTGEGFDETLSYQQDNGVFTFTSKSSVTVEKTATLTFTSWDGVQLGVLNVKVVPPTISSIRIVPAESSEPATWTIPLGGTKMFNVQVAMSDAPDTFTTVTDTDNIFWEALSGVEHITGRVFKGKTKGAAKIKATYFGREAISEGQVVDGAYVEGSFIIKPASADVSVSATKDFKAYARFTDKENEVDVTDQCVWTSDFAANLTINHGGVKGRVLGKEPKDGCKVKAQFNTEVAEATVNVKAKSVKTVYIYTEPEGQHDVNVGGTLQLKVKVDYDNSDLSGVVDEIAASKVSWNSLYPDIASVSSNGLVTGKKGGSVTISAAFGGKSGSYLISVNKKPVSLSITPAKDAPEDSRTVVEKGVLSFGATVTFDDGTTESVTNSQSVTFTSSDSQTATFTGSTLTGIKPGTVLVGCVYRYDNNTKSLSVEGADRTTVIIKAGTVTYDNLKITSFGYGIIPAAGGSVTPSDISYSARQTTTYGAGSPDVRTITGNISYADAKDYLSIVTSQALNGVAATFTASNGSVSAPSLGTALTNERNVYLLGIKLTLFDLTSDEFQTNVKQAQNEEIVLERQMREVKNEWKIEDFSVLPTSLGREGGELVFNVTETFMSQRQYKRHFSSGGIDPEWINDGPATKQTVTGNDIPDVYVKTNPEEAASAKSGQKNVYSVAANGTTSQRTFVFAVKDDAHSVSEKELSVSQEIGRVPVGLRIKTDVPYSPLYINTTFNVTGVYIRYNDNTTDTEDIKNSCTFSIKNGLLTRNGFSFIGSNSGNEVITVTYEGFSETIDVEVRNNTVVSTEFGAPMLVATIDGAAASAGGWLKPTVTFRQLRTQIFSDGSTKEDTLEGDVFANTSTITNIVETIDSVEGIETPPTIINHMIRVGEIKEREGQQAGTEVLIIANYNISATINGVSSDVATAPIRQVRDIATPDTEYFLEYSLGDGTVLGRSTKSAEYIPVIFYGETLYARQVNAQTLEEVKSRQFVAKHNDMSKKMDQTIESNLFSGEPKVKYVLSRRYVVSHETRAANATAHDFKGDLQIVYNDGTTERFQNGKFSSWMYSHGGVVYELENGQEMDFDAEGISPSANDWWSAVVLLPLLGDEHRDERGNIIRRVEDQEITVFNGGAPGILNASLNSGAAITLNEENFFSTYLTGTVTYNGGTVNEHVNPDRVVIANPSVLRYEGAGRITGIAGGETQVDVYFGGKKCTCTVTVIPWVSKSVSVTYESGVISQRPLNSDWLSCEPTEQGRIRFKFSQERFDNGTTREHEFTATTNTVKCTIMKNELPENATVSFNFIDGAFVPVLNYNNIENFSGEVTYKLQLKGYPSMFNTFSITIKCKEKLIRAQQN